MYGTTCDSSLSPDPTTATGINMWKSMKDLSNSRCSSQYFPLFGIVVPQQVAERGDLWPYSTRCTEGRGARYKRIHRRITCERRPAEEVWRAVQNLKLSTHAFKKQAYRSKLSLQLTRTAVAQEEAAHRENSRSHIKTTGRNTLYRTLPKWVQDELPEMGYLLDPDVLPALVDKAIGFFRSLTNSELQEEEIWGQRIAAIPR